MFLRTTPIPRTFRVMEKGYVINRPKLDLTVDEIKKKLTKKQFKTLIQHATCLACIDGNAFDFCIEQYCFDAYINLWQNSHVGDEYDLPNIFSVTAAQYYADRHSES